ncbi:hypothetical protein HGRIS_013961 [Hohenbuehelia grisea]|uniref:Uncharacterized protein n=1 Tax=Hohenbuehelia grisea TaxID=104357 RepID=A0ABR3JRY8_9AGAR
MLSQRENPVSLRFKDVSYSPRLFPSSPPDSWYAIDLLKHKSQSDVVADGAADWVVDERKMRERLKKEKEVTTIWFLDLRKISYGPQTHPSTKWLLELRSYAVGLYL